MCSPTPSSHGPLRSLRTGDTLLAFANGRLRVAQHPVNPLGLGVGVPGRKTYKISVYFLGTHLTCPRLAVRRGQMAHKMF